MTAHAFASTAESLMKFFSNPSAFAALIAASLLAVASVASAENVEFAWAGGVGGNLGFGAGIAVDASGNV